MKIYKLKQRTEEWFRLRRGKMTASQAQCIASNGRGFESYIYSIVAEKHSNSNDENYINKDMQRGIDLEGQARMVYELENSKVDEVGFVEMDKYVGCSPDGLIGKNAGLEIKCPNDTNYCRILANGQNEINTGYIWQCQMSLLVTGRKFWDLAFYNPNFKQDLIVFKLFPDKLKFDKLMIGIEKGKKMIKEIENKMKGGGKI